MSRMECGQPGTFPVDVVSKSFLERYGERLLSSLKAHSTSTSMKVNEFADLPTSEYVSQYTGYKPNNVWTQFARESYQRDVTYGIQSSPGVQDCTCECPRNQAGYMVRWMRLTPKNKVGIHQGTCWNEHVVSPTRRARSHRTS